MRITRLHKKSKQWPWLRLRMSFLHICRDKLGMLLANSVIKNSTKISWKHATLNTAFLILFAISVVALLTSSLAPWRSWVKIITRKKVQQLCALNPASRNSEEVFWKNETAIFVIYRIIGTADFSYLISGP